MEKIVESEQAIRKRIKKIVAILPLLMSSFTFLKKSGKVSIANPIIA
jgi:hypothetical protein